MTEQEKNQLLEEAKNRYPPEVEFRCLVTNDIYKLPKNAILAWSGDRIYSYINNSLFHKHYDSFTKTWAEVTSKSEYVEFLDTGFTNFTKGKIYKLDSKGNCQMDNGNFTTGSMQYPKDKDYLKPSTKEAYEAQSKSTDTWIPEIGDWIVAVTPELTFGCKAIKNKAYKIQSIRVSNSILKLEDCNEIKTEHCRKAEPHEIPNDNSMVKKDSYITTLDDSYIGKYVSLLNDEVVLTPETYGYSSAEYSISIDPITPKQAIKSIFDKNFNNPLNEVLELPKSSKKKTKQLIY
jgi:hypothetical protein